MVERILSPMLLKERALIYQETVEGRQFDAFYFSMMICACLLALLGLLMNSPAVIIGAMLISPLMGPVLACGLALATAEWPIGRKAARNVVFSIIEVVLIAAIATRLSPLRDVTPEILARTNPNIMDLLVALFSGLAGTLAACSKRAGAAIVPGVAIAVAVMPPLATTGYGIATSQWQIAGGAFMLFFTNLTAIMLSSSLVFAVAGFRPIREVAGEPHPWLVRYRIAVAVGVLVVLCIPLARTLIRTVRQAQVRTTTRNVLRDQLATQGQRVDNVSVQMLHDRVTVEATVQTQHYIGVERIRSVERALSRELGHPVALAVQQVQLASDKPSDFIASAVVHPAKVDPPEPPSASVGKVQERVRSALADSLGAIGFTDVQVLAVGKQPDGSFLVEIAGTAPSATDADTWRLAAFTVAGVVGAPVRLRGDILLANDSLPLPFPGKSVRLAPQASRALRQFATKHAVPGMQFALVSDPSTEPELAEQRAVGVKLLLPGPVTTLPNLPPAEQPGMTVHVIQHIDNANVSSTSRSGDAVSKSLKPAS